MHNQPDAAADTAEAREDIDEAIAQLEEALATIKRYRHGRKNARSLAWALGTIDTAADTLGWLDIASTWTTTQAAQAKRSNQHNAQPARITAPNQPRMER